MTLSRRNNILTGFFLIAGVVGAVAASVVLSDARRRLVPTNQYHLQFDLIQGAAGIVPGSEVQVGGRVAGRVIAVDFAFDDPQDPRRATGIDIRFELPRAIQLYENAAATLVQPLIGTMSSINIIALGDGSRVERPQGAGPVLEPGETLVGQIAPPSFLAQAGYGPEQAESVRTIISRTEQMVTRFDELVAYTDEQVRPALDQVNETLADVRSMASDIREREPRWADAIDSTLAELNNAAEQADQAVTEFRQSVDEGRGLIADARATLSDNRPQIDSIVDNVDSITGRVDTESVELLNSALASADEGAARFSEVAATAAELLAENRPEIRRAMANIRLASDQLKLTMVEVRRNPWRLLYRPGAKESRTEILYDAARSYAAAVSDLRAASESLEVATARDAPESERITELLASLAEAFKRYEQTERTLLDLLGGE